jgi:hypothetical protein
MAVCAALVHVTNANANASSTSKSTTAVVQSTQFGETQADRDRIAALAPPAPSSPRQHLLLLTTPHLHISISTREVSKPHRIYSKQSPHQQATNLEFRLPASY